MSNSASFTQLIQELDVALAVRRDLRQRGIQLIVTHLYHIPGMACSAGEMIGDIAIRGFPEPVSLGFSHMSLLLMDCFCRYRMPLTAVRIEEIMHSDPFYIHYSANCIGRDHIALPERSSVRVYVWRIRKQMEKVFRDVGLRFDPQLILTSETTETNVLIYKLKATVEFLHVNGSACK